MLFCIRRTFWVNSALVGVMIRKCSGSDACQLVQVSSALDRTVEGFLWSDVFNVESFLTQALRQLVSTLETDTHGILTDQSVVILRASVWSPPHSHHEVRTDPQEIAVMENLPPPMPCRPQGPGQPLPAPNGILPTPH